MARRDKIHYAVKNALIKDGWEITADPFHIKYKDVEIKSFLRPSAIHELQAALGQYQMYEVFLKLNGSERELFLAVSLTIWEQFFLTEAVADLIEKMNIRIIVVDLITEEIRLWKK